MCEGDLFLHFPSGEWIPCHFLIGFFVGKKVVVRPYNQAKTEQKSEEAPFLSCRPSNRSSRWLIDRFRPI